MNTNRFSEDLHRPGYHFVAPGEYAVPGDPNGAFFADGVYHLMFLYQVRETEGFHWGHLVSTDLLNWKRLPDALTVHEGDGGCFSGGAFLDDDGTAYLTFWKFAAKDPAKDRSGIAMAKARPPYEVWERMEPIAINASYWGVRDETVDGETVHLGNADPSNIWKQNGIYYMQTGNLCVLNEFGREENSPEMYQGDWTELYRSKDLVNWEFVHRFYAHEERGDDLPDRTEDDMCPSFLPLYDAPSGGKLTDKWLQLCIAHNKGCRYYVGTVEGETFHPEIHERMSWKDNAFFAPEALIDDKNRHIMWAWLRDEDFERQEETYGWNGIYSFPRVLWWDEKRYCLRMAPAEELDALQGEHQVFASLQDGIVPVKNGTSFRMKAKWSAGTEGVFGFRVKESADGREYTEILVDRENGKLVMDLTKSGYNGEWDIREEAPLKLEKGEDVELDIFVDGCVVEVYCNALQAICRRAYPTDPASCGVRLAPDSAAPTALEVWEMRKTTIE